MENVFGMATHALRSVCPGEYGMKVARNYLDDDLTCYLPLHNKLGPYLPALDLGFFKHVDEIWDDLEVVHSINNPFFLLPPDGVYNEYTHAYMVSRNKKHESQDKTAIIREKFKDFLFQNTPRVGCMFIFGAFVAQKAGKTFLVVVTRRGFSSVALSLFPNVVNCIVLNSYERMADNRICNGYSVELKDDDTCCYTAIQDDSFKRMNLRWYCSVRWGVEEIKSVLYVYRNIDLLCELENAPNIATSEEHTLHKLVCDAEHSFIKKSERISEVRFLSVVLTNNDVVKLLIGHRTLGDSANKLASVDLDLKNFSRIS